MIKNQSTIPTKAATSLSPQPNRKGNNNICTHHATCAHLLRSSKEPKAACQKVPMAHGGAKLAGQKLPTTQQQKVALVASPNCH
eukprot:5167978-Amphidinium_carterae.1